MLTATQVGFFPRRYEITGAGSQPITLRILGLRAAGHFSFEGKNYVARTNGFGGRFNLERVGKVIAYVNKRLLTRKMEVFSDGEAFQLEAKHPFSREFEYTKGARLLGTIKSEICFGRNLKGSFEGGSKIIHQVFLLWHVSWMNRQRKRS